MTRAAQPIEAVIFDWGGTITPWHDVDLYGQWQAFSRGYGALACAQHDLVGRLLAAEDEGWRRGREEGSSLRLDDILRACGLDPASAPAQAGLLAYEAYWEPHTFTHPAIPSVWEWLRDNGIAVGVLSNTVWTRARHEAIFARDGVLDLIGAAVYSSETPWVKPAPEIFRAVADALGVDPAACVYVGDRSYEDVHGPQQVGMRAIWVPHSDIPEAQQVAHDAVPDAVAHEIDDICDIVDAWRRGHALPDLEPRAG